MLTLHGVIMKAMVISASLYPLVSVAAETTVAPPSDGSEVIDLRMISCRDFLRADSDEQSDLLVFLHGFISGTQDEAIIDGEKLAKASDASVNSCIDNPESMLFSIVEQNRK